MCPFYGIVCLAIIATFDGLGFTCHRAEYHYFPLIPVPPHDIIDYIVLYQTYNVISVIVVTVHCPIH